MSDKQPEYPAISNLYLERRFAQLQRRGDLVREYKKTAVELRESLMADIRAGRKRSAVIHFRSFADYCLASLFVAYPASEEELDKKKSPQDLPEVAKRVIKHWDIPIPPEDLKKLQKLYHKLSRAAHGTIRAVKTLDTWAAAYLSNIEEACNLLIQLADEADSRLNSRR